MRPLKVLFLESFFGGSHRAFAEGFAAHSRHEVDLHTLPGQEWRRRQRLAAAAFAEEIRDLSDYDAILATDLLDLADFNATLGATRPTLLYMHETQCTYPLPKGRTHDDDTVFFDVKNCRLADRVVFNSAVHRDAFLSAIGPRLRAAGEINGSAWLRSIEERATVVYPGVDVTTVWSVAAGAAPDAAPAGAGRSAGAQPPAGAGRSAGAQPPAGAGRSAGARPANIVWNHRWEYDKNPPAFFRALDALAAEGLDFTVTLLGENPQAHPKDFESARERLGDRIVHYGYAEDRRRYLELLASGDVVVSTSNQENFGIAMVEAIAAGCRPVLPKRLSYPEIVPERFHESCLYTSQRSLLDTLRRAVSAQSERGRDLGPEQMRALQDAMMTYDWSRSAARLDAVLAEIAGTAAPRHERPWGPDG